MSVMPHLSGTRREHSRPDCRRTQRVSVQDKWFARASHHIFGVTTCFTLALSDRK